MIGRGLFVAPALLVLAGCGGSPPEAPQGDARPADFTGPFRAASIELPADDALFPEGTGSALLNENCLACHSASMVLTQPKLTAEQWQATLDKMRSVYKAPLDPANDPALVAALLVANADADAR